MGYTKNEIKSVDKGFRHKGLICVLLLMSAVGIIWVRVTVMSGVVDEKERLRSVQLWENGPYWANCNLGASKPEMFGLYYMWGQTRGFKWDGKPLSNVHAGYVTFTSIEDLRTRGIIDSAGRLVPGLDAATVHLGAPWRMPTDEEFSALHDNCTCEWTTRNGVEGLLVTGKGKFARKSIFLPAAGCDSGAGIGFTQPTAFVAYWSSTPRERNRNYIESKAHSFDVDKGLGFSSGYYDDTYCEKPIRPVRDIPDEIE